MTNSSDAKNRAERVIQSRNFQDAEIIKQSCEIVDLTVDEAVDV
jgi:hypothetical protein